jgi:hypothetical protein
MPGSVINAPIEHDAPDTYMLIDKEWFWTGASWDVSMTLIRLLTSDLRNVPAARRRYLRAFGYL